MYCLSLTAKPGFYILLTYTFTISSILCILTVLYSINELTNFFATYLGILTLFFVYDLNKLLTDSNYFSNFKFNFILRFYQVVSFFFSLVSIGFLLTKDNYSNYDNFINITTGFYFHTLIVILLNSLYIRKFSNIRVQDEYSLKLYKDHIRGIITEDIIDNCSICLEGTDLEKGEKEEIVVLNCTHKYHYKCLNSCFLNQIKRCPMCRENYI